MKINMGLLGLQLTYGQQPRRESWYESANRLAAGALTSCWSGRSALDHDCFSPSYEQFLVEAGLGLENVVSYMISVILSSYTFQSSSGL